MEDLLNEDDFLQKPPANPWNYFRWYYLASVLFLALFFVVTVIYQKGTDETAIAVLVISVFIMPLVLATMMMWLRKKNFLLPNTTIILALLILNGIYMVCLTAMALANTVKSGSDILSESFLDGLGLVVLAYVATFIISAAVILPVAARKKRKAQISV